MNKITNYTCDYNKENVLINGSADIIHFDVNLFYVT